MSQRRKRVYLTIIAVGLVLVVIDRVWLAHDGEPLSPRTAAGASPLSSAGAGRSAGAAGTGADIAAEWFPPPAIRLPASWPELPTSDAGSRRDPFVPSLSHVGASTTGARGEGGGDAEGAPPAASFAESHRLEAIIISRTSRHAVVDDLILSRGDVLDGHRLVQIGLLGVVFEGPQGRVVLELPRHEAGTGG
jgi:hypothetical protein